MAPNVLSAVKMENTIMVGNVNHVTAPVQHVQVSDWHLRCFPFLPNFSSDFIFSLLLRSSYNIMCLLTYNFLILLIVL